MVSSLLGSSPMVADEFRRQADTFVELAVLEPRIARPRPEPRMPIPARPDLDILDTA